MRALVATIAALPPDAARGRLPGVVRPDPPGPDRGWCLAPGRAPGSGRHHLVHRLHRVRERRDGQRGLQEQQRHDVLADVLRAQLHQLRRLPDGQERHAQQAALVRWRQRDLLGQLHVATSPTRCRPWVRWPGGRPTPARPAPRATWPTSRRSSPTTRSSSRRTAGAVTSPGRAITKGTSWPSGFIHFNDLELKNTERPTVSGVARVGQVLSATLRRLEPQQRRPTAMSGAPAARPSRTPPTRPSRCVRPRRARGSASS